MHWQMGRLLMLTRVLVAQLEGELRTDQCIVIGLYKGDIQIMWPTAHLQLWLVPLAEVASRPAAFSCTSNVTFVLPPVRN
jgi:hypothetical protein